MARFASVYDGAVVRLAHPSWRDLYESLKSDKDRFRYLNAAQLVKHYLGLKNTFEDRHVKLVYAFWEPSNREDFSEFRNHREEVSSFERAVDDPSLSFIGLSYLELWDDWESRDEPTWLRKHVSLLRARYDVAI